MFLRKFKTIIIEVKPRSQIPDSRDSTPAQRKFNKYTRYSVILQEVYRGTQLWLNLPSQSFS